MSDVHDDPERDWALASAYVDGDVDAAQRARVDGDAHLGGLVAEIRAMRAALAAPVDVPATTRDAAIATALGSFVVTAESGVTSPSAAVSSLDDRRRRRMRWVGGSAAAAIVALMIGLAVRDRPADDQLSSAAKSPASTVAAGLHDAAAGAVEAGEAGQTSSQRDAAAPAAAPAPTTFAAATPTASPAAGGGSPAAADALPTALDEPAQLLDLPASSLASTAGSTSATTLAGAATTGSSPSCVASGEVVLAVITYRGVPAIAVVDLDAHVRRARALVGCSILAEVVDPS